MVNFAETSSNQAVNLLQQQRSKIWEKLKSGNAEENIVTGGNSFTDTVWNRMLEGVDSYLEEVRADQKVRFAKRDEQQQKEALFQKRLREDEMQEEYNMKEILTARTGGTLNVPYGFLAKDGIIEYNGAVFICDEEHHAICLGDMTNPSEILTIPLAEGGCLKVNRENLGELAKAISMFSPEDIRRIMEAIAQDTKCQQMKLELDETVNSVSGSTTIVSKAESNDGGELTAEQIAELFIDREGCFVSSDKQDR